MKSHLEIRHPTAETIPYVVYEALRKALIHGYFEPGERLVERQLGDQLNVSRTPIREALYQLEKERLIVRVPYRGFFVASPTLEEAMALYQVRLMLEPTASRLAAQNMSPEQMERLKASFEAGRRAAEESDAAGVKTANAEFHLLIAEASGNPWLLEMVYRLQGHISLLRHASVAKRLRSRAIVGEHERILRAILKRDGAAAERAVRQHLETARKNLEALFRQADGPES